ncbi:MAG: ThiF family adenylyltransferase [Planctomycetes bacterium]|nr:ThiF family adenylyltransferase [Planctomycetota bacterium]
MAHLVQVGLGSGGMSVIDMLVRDIRISKLTLIEPDILKPHNLSRHLLGSDSVGNSKLLSAVKWLKDRNRNLEIISIDAFLQEPEKQAQINNAIKGADLGVCAVDNEEAKYHWCSLMRHHCIPWTLGEVLSGGIGGFIHTFVPGGPCYACACTYLKREGPKESKDSKPDYSHPSGQVEEARIPASFASIQTIAALHALATIDLLDAKIKSYSFLLPLQKVDGIFSESLKKIVVNISKNESCLFCRGEVKVVNDVDDLLQKKLKELSGGLGS